MMRNRSLRADRIGALEERCRRHGLPVTIQRRTIFEYLADRDDHPSADQIYNAVRARIPGVSRTTIYRVLETLIRIGVLSKVCHPGSATRFDAKKVPHHHLVCSVCDRLVDIEDSRIDRLPLPGIKKQGFRITHFSILFHGLCSECRQRPEEPTDRRRKRCPTLKTT